MTVNCSRCGKALGEYDPTDPHTAGFYVVTGGSWARYAKQGEEFLCDHCMWTDPSYQAENPNAVPLPRTA